MVEFLEFLTYFTYGQKLSKDLTLHDSSEERKKKKLEKQRLKRIEAADRQKEWEEERLKDIELEIALNGNTNEDDQVIGIDHVTFYVGCSSTVAAYLVDRYGFKPFASRGLTEGERDYSSEVVVNGNIILSFISPLKRNPEQKVYSFSWKWGCTREDATKPKLKSFHKHLSTHGDSVKDVAFRVKNVEKAFNFALKNGAKCISKPAQYRDEYGVVGLAIVTGLGDTTHTLIERKFYRGFLPGYRMSDEKLDPNKKSGNFRRYAYNIIDSSNKEEIEVLFATLKREFMESGKLPAFETSPSSGKDPVETDLLDIKIETPKEGTSAEELEQQVVIEVDSNNEVNAGINVEQNSDSKESLPVKLDDFDHVVQNVNWNSMFNSAEYYRKCFDFKRFWSVDEKDVSTEYSCLRSTVMASNNERVKMPINEPAMGLKKSQIEEFLDYNVNKPGVQHIAMRTSDIIETVSRLRERGVNFVTVPASYYTNLKTRLSNSPILINEDLALLEKEQILVDFDDKGYLLQIFTKPIFSRPTFFFEIIQRNNHNGFGAGNFKALFEALEKEQKQRGNLV
ncbi:unnamed protein product [[Candida] boidinii]|uniref:Unnamed protein product n=1 Tax=Candida boidinii TaxID=5477 RepID=A0A9W6T1R5_CANBO|nr:oxidoreductase activity, acting on single donors with incorporation of molecular oxygen protein [[Candida] boidinii]OWB86723.1 oxidoreductase activity, acting on single donors with incorporation of molecular oxygen protein [[Candida] boidinii]GME73306.1 unnamed protein product [[Candida] boidinii]GMF97944.1 unnamed protein product [[Candida] boidinii]